MHPVVIAIPILILIAWGRVFRPFNGRIEGTVLQVRRLPLLARIRMHAVSSVAQVLVAVALVVTGQMHWAMLGLPLVSIALLMTIPVNYVITDHGIRLGWTEFRRWTEFAGVRRARFGARLIGNAGGRSLSIWLSDSRGDDEFLHFLRGTLKHAWRGSYTHQASADVASVTHSSLADSAAPVAAFSVGDQV